MGYDMVDLIYGVLRVPLMIQTIQKNSLGTSKLAYYCTNILILYNITTYKRRSRSRHSVLEENGP